jgi:hypothetical protein
MSVLDISMSTTNISVNKDMTLFEFAKSLVSNWSLTAPPVQPVQVEPVKVEPVKVEPVVFPWLKSWKLTLPTGQPEKPTEIEDLTDPVAIQCDSFRIFYNPQQSGIVFKAKVDGVTTKGSSYPRSELREMIVPQAEKNAKTEASWATTAGKHSLKVRQAVLNLPVRKPQLVTAQIHDSKDDLIMIRCSRLRPKTKLDPPTIILEIVFNDTQHTILDDNYQLGTIFDLEIQAESGVLTILYQNKVVKIPSKKSGCYFKAGCYTQSNLTKGDEPDAYGEVVVYEASVTHTK